MFPAYKNLSIAGCALLPKELSHSKGKKSLPSLQHSPEPFACVSLEACSSTENLIHMNKLSG